MAFLEGLLSFCNELLVFYIPTFFTFKYLMANENERVRTILKFWVILAFHYLLVHLLEYIVKGYFKSYIRYLLVILDFAALGLLNWDHFKNAELLYDKFIGPLYRDNQTLIQKYSGQIQKLFEKNSEAIKSKVATSAGEKIKGFMGEVLVGVLNPSAQKKNNQQRMEREERGSDEQEDQQ